MLLTLQMWASLSQKLTVRPVWLPLPINSAYLCTISLPIWQKSNKFECWSRNTYLVLCNVMFLYMILFLKRIDDIAGCSCQRLCCMIWGFGSQIAFWSCCHCQDNMPLDSHDSVEQETWALVNTKSSKAVGYSVHCFKLYRWYLLACNTLLFKFKGQWSRHHCTNGNHGNMGMAVCRHRIYKYNVYKIWLTNSSLMDL